MHTHWDVVSRVTSHSVCQYSCLQFKLSIRYAPFALDALNTFVCKALNIESSSTGWCSIWSYNKDTLLVAVTAWTQYLYLALQLGGENMDSATWELIRIGKNHVGIGLIMPSLCRDHTNLLCIVPILTSDRGQIHASTGWMAEAGKRIRSDQI